MDRLRVLVCVYLRCGGGREVRLDGGGLFFSQQRSESQDGGGGYICVLAPLYHHVVREFAQEDLVAVNGKET